MRRALLPLACLLTLACASSEGGEGDKSPKDAAAQPAEKTEPAAEPAEKTAEPTAEPDEDRPPPGVKIKGNLPVMTESELAAESAARDACIAKCVDAKKAEARAPEAIEDECRGKCLAEIPIQQVEVVPDSPE